MTGALVSGILRSYGLHTSPELCAKIRDYVELLVLWNQKLSLTSITNPKEIIGRHFGESLFAVHAVPLSPARLVDIGSGAGFPGLALKLVLPTTEITLVEANAKKAAFLKEVVRRLELKHVNIVRSRTEEMKLSSPIADCVTARAVGGFDSILRWSFRALETDGTLVLWVGAQDAESILRASDWSWMDPIPIPNSARRVLLVGKKRKTP